MIKDFKGRKVLILGLGLNEGGVGSAKFFANAGSHVRVTDLKDEKTLKPSLEKLWGVPNIQYVLGQHRKGDIEWADLIIRNQAIKPGNEFLEYAKELGKEIETDMGIFLQFVNPKQLIGVTGTKGKSTVSSLIYEVLKNGGKKVLFGGNIGKSVLDIVPLIESDTTVVLELSSFQLESFDEKKISPHIGIITNIFEDHLNYYESFESYVSAKKVIAKYQTPEDSLLLWKDDQVAQVSTFLSSITSTIINFSKDDLPEEFDPSLKGEHNLNNAAAAYEVGKLLKIDEGKIISALQEFKGVPFRLELIKNSNGIKIYNDTTATNPSAAIASLRALPSCILICGGQNANMDYTGFADTIDKYVKSVYFLDGDATDEIRSLLKHKNIQRGTYKSLDQLLKDVKAEAKTGDTILLSPGAKSFNMFQNEFDRGRKFNQIVERLFT